MAKRKFKKATARADHGRRVIVKRADSMRIGLIVNVGDNFKQRTLYAGDGVAAWLTRAQARRIRDSITKWLQP